MAAVAELGYRPNAAARNLVHRRSHTVGILVLDLHNPIYAEIIDGVQSELRSNGFHAMLVTGNEDPDLERAELEKLLEFQVEGLILIGHRMPAGALAAIAGHCPAVIVSRKETTTSGLDSVSNDDIAGARMAVNHLVALGHTHIAHITGGDNQVARLRKTGYEQAMTDHGLGDQIICITGAFTDDGGYSGASAALGQVPRPTAMFVANDLAAVGALAAVQDQGLRVPEDISIIGYDGMALGGLRSLSITTIAQPLTAMGTSAAELLLARIATPGQPSVHRGAVPALIARNSTAARSDS